MYNAGDFQGTETVTIPFNAFTSDDPSASVTVTNLANTDVYIHKDASLTQRTSSSGVAVDIDVDGITGCHWVTVDLSDNDDAGFYAAGSQYVVRLEGITVDGATLNVFIGGFTIGKMQAAMTAALVAHNLDHLCLTATAGADMTTEVADNTILSRILADGDTSDFTPSTDGLQPLRDHIGDGTNLTEAGGDGDHLTEAGGDGDHLTEAGGDGDHLVEAGGTGDQLSAIPWNASWDAEVESEVDDALGGGTGTALSAIPWNAAWDAEVQSEVTDALVAANLDHLCLTATAGADMTTEVADNTILSRILANGDTSAFTPETDGLQPLRDHIGDGTNLTEAGGDGDHLTEAGGDGDHLTEAGGDGDHLTEAGGDGDHLVEAGGTGDQLSAIPWNAAWDAEVESEVDDALGGGTGTSLTAIPWNAAWDAEVESEVDDALGGGTGTALTAVPWNAAWDAEVQSEVDDALKALALTQATYAPQEAPPVDATLPEALAYLYKAWRNKSTSDENSYDLYADDGSTIDQTAALSDDETTFTRGEVGSGA